MQKEPKSINVVSYIRESTTGQMLHGHRPETQRKNIERYCEQHKFKIIKEFSDAGSGGGTRKRPEFRKMIEFVKSSDIRFIVIDEADRFFRNLHETLNFEKELEQHGVFAVDTRIDYSPREYLTEDIPEYQWGNRMDARMAAERERKRIQRRVKEGYKEKAANGMYVGEVVYGMEWKDKHKKFIGYKEDEAKVVKKIFELYATGNYGFTTLARHLNEMGYMRKVAKIKEVVKGGSTVQERELIDTPFTVDVIRGTLKNKSFIGIQNTRKHLRLKTLNEEGEAEPLKPLIDEEDFNYVNQMIQQNQRGKPAHRVRKTSRQKSVFLLQGIGFSAVNGEKLHGDTETNRRTKAKKRRYVVSSNRKGDKNPIPSMSADEIEEKIIELIKHVQVNGIGTIEKLLCEAIKVEAGAFKGKISGLTTSTETTKLKKAIKALKEVQKMNYSHQTDSTIKAYEKQLQSLSKAKPRTKEEMKYYNLLLLRNVLQDIQQEFITMQNLAKREELVKMLFSDFFVGKSSEIKPADHFHGTINGRTKAEVKKDSKKLKALLQKFTPYLFEKIYVKKERSILKVSFTLTGLFILLTENEARESDKRRSQGSHFDPHGEARGNGSNTLPAHHLKQCSIFSAPIFRPVLS